MKIFTFQKLFKGIAAIVLLLISITTGAQNTSATWGGNGNSAWYTTTNWAGGSYAGVQGAAASNAYTATFTSAFTGTTVGINMGTNSLNLGAIVTDNTRITALNVGNSSATGGVLRLYGATVNSVANTVVRNNGTALITLQAAQNGSMGIVLGNATENIFEIDNTGGITISSIISDLSGNKNLTRAGAGAGILTLTNPGNSYTGVTSIPAGEIRLNPTNTTATFASQIKLDGGKLATTNIAVNTVITSSSTLNLNSSSTLALGTNVHSLKFANSNAVTWANATLTITGWTGTVGAGTTGTAGKIFFGTSNTHLTPAQLAKIKFNISGVNYAAAILSTGEIVPVLKYVITSISPASPTAGNTFSVTVQSQDFDGNVVNVGASGSSFVLSTNGNAGAIGGTTTGTIPASSSSITVNNVSLPSSGTNVTITATQTSGDLLAAGTSSVFTVAGVGGSPTKLAITAITPSSPTKNSSFSVTVEAEDNSNVAQNVTLNTDVLLSLNTGNGTLGGTLSGTILAGTNSIIISGVTYNTVESGVVITATRTAGDALTAGNSSAFVVQNTVADHLAFVSVPTTGTINTNLSSFTVEARRADNTVDNAYSANIVVAKATGSGTLSGTASVAAVNGVATFSTLQFNAADVYTLSATSGALTSATSGNITVSEAYLTLTTSPYTQNFNSIGTGLPTGWTGRTGATASVLGTSQTLNTTQTLWSSTSGQFANSASVNGSSSTDNTATQNANADRAFAVRQTGSFADPGAAFVVHIANTTGKNNFSLNFKLMELDPTASAGRTTTWNVDYGVGVNPTTWTNATTSPASITTTVNNWGSTTVTVNFGSALDNQSGEVWIRISAKTAATGTGSRPNTAIDDVSLSWATAATKLAITNISPISPTTNTAFSVTVQAQDVNGNAANVTGNTNINLSVNSGTGSISGGTTAGMISSGTSSVVISGVKYSVGESGVILTASDGASILTSGISSSFTVQDPLPPADHLTFVSVPTTGTVNTNLTSFTVEARRPDNSVDNSYSTNIVISKATGSGTLSGTTSVTPVNGIATFSTLQFNAADVYTITASSGTLLPETSGNITISDVTASTDYFRSNATGGGPWSSLSTWQSSHDGSTGWITATSLPGGSAAQTNIRSGDVVTVSANQTGALIVVNGQLTINSGVTLTLSSATGFDVTVNGTLLNSGTLTLTGCTMSVASGGTYIHNTASSASTLFGLTTLNANSTVIYRDFLSSGITTAPAVSISGRTYGNLKFESVTGAWSNTPSGSSATSATDFNIGSGVTITNNYTGTFTVNGNFIVNGTLTNGTGTQTFTLTATGGTISGTGLSNFFDVLNLTGTYSLGNSFTSGSATTINLGASAVLNLNGKQLTLGGPLTGTGTLSGSATSDIIIAGTVGTLNFTSGSQTLHDLTLNAASSATLGTAVRIASGASAGTVTVNTGATLTTGGNLTIGSDLNGTARIANSPGTITGDVTVERYIPQNATRAWRFLAAPTAGQTIHEAWQENQAAGVAGTSGFGTLITKSATNSPGTGFDAVTVGTSILTYNSGADGWDEVTSTSNLLDNSTPYMLYIRGDRTAAISTSISSTNVTTLRSKGSVYQNVSIPVAVSGDKFMAVGNPYASAINYHAIPKNGGIDSAFYVWDPKLAGFYGVGGYVTITTLDGGVTWRATPTGGSYSAGNINPYLESGQAFLVHATTIPGTLTLSQASKVAGPQHQVFAPTVAVPVLTTTLFAGNNSSQAVADGNMVVFGAYANAVDGNDAVKMRNFAENFGITRNGSKLAVEKRETITAKDTVYFYMTNLKQQAYTLHIAPENLENINAYLIDKYLNMSSVIDMANGTDITFNVTSDAGSSTSDRFKIVFSPSSALPVSFLGLSVYQKNSGVQLDWKVSTESGITSYEIERSATGANFNKQSSVAFSSANAGKYSWFDNAPNMGMNFYRIAAADQNGKRIYTNIVKVNTANVNSSIVVAPNPVTGKIANIQFNNISKGDYFVNIINLAGQTLYTEKVYHNGGSSSIALQLPSTIGSGVYQLEIKTTEKVVSVQKLAVN